MKRSDFLEVLGKGWTWSGYNHHFIKTGIKNNLLIFIAPNLTENKLGLKFCKQCTCCNNIVDICTADVSNIEEFQTLLSMLKEFE